MGFVVGSLFRWGSNIVALLVASWLIDGMDYGDVWTLIIAALVFSLVNFIVKPIVTVLALPAVILTLGIALFFINVFMLYLTDWIVGGFESGSFWDTVLGALIIWAVNFVLSVFLKPEER
jgi:putative membrane protein